MRRSSSLCTASWWQGFLLPTGSPGTGSTFFCLIAFFFLSGIYLSLDFFAHFNGVCVCVMKKQDFIPFCFVRELLPWIVSINECEFKRNKTRLLLLDSQNVLMHYKMVLNSFVIPTQKFRKLNVNFICHVRFILYGVL
jgi:hypothetical protein